MNSTFQNVFTCLFANVSMGYFFVIGYHQLLKEPLVDSVDSLHFVDIGKYEISENGRLAFHFLKNTDRFEHLWIGPAPSFSKSFDAFSILLHEKDSENIMKRLYNQGSLEAKIYAAIVLANVDSDLQEVLINTFQQSNKEVVYHFGCTPWSTKLSKLDFSGFKQDLIETANKRYPYIKDKPFNLIDH